jgi:putative FmdB family regulatory protein
MPIYEYECRTCRHQFEQFERPRPSNPLPDHAPVCPSCNGHDLERLLSGFAVSSAATRAANIQQARKAGVKTSLERKQADAELTRHIIEEHNN